MRKQCKRKIYAKVNPIQYAMEGARLMTPEELQDLRDKENKCLDNMTKGVGTVYDWRELAEAINLCWMFANHGVGPEALVSCELAIIEMDIAKERYHKTGKFGLSGSGIHAIKDVLEYAALQQVSISRSEFEKMITKTRNKITGLIAQWKGRKDGKPLRLRQQEA